MSSLIKSTHILTEATISAHQSLPTVQLFINLGEILALSVLGLSSSIGSASDLELIFIVARVTATGLLTVETAAKENAERGRTASLALPEAGICEIDG